MSYTRPAHNSADATWVGAGAYTRSAYDVADAAWAPVDPLGRALDAGPLGAQLFLGTATSACWALADSMLGEVLALGRHITAGRVAMPGVMIDDLVIGKTDFTNAIREDSSFYVLDLATPSGVVRVPMSSWQATLQTDRASYVQAAVRAVADYVDAINAATSFTIHRQAWALDGSILAEAPVAWAPVSNVQLAQGAFNYSATISGYSDAFTYNDSPDSSFDRTLKHVQTVFTDPSGLRVRCAIDWFLRPGQRAWLDSTPLIVGYMNLYVNETQAFMDVGERRL